MKWVLKIDILHRPNNFTKVLAKSPIYIITDIRVDKIRCSCALYGLNEGSKFPNYKVISGVKVNINQVTIHIFKLESNIFTHK